MRIINVVNWIILSLTWFQCFLLAFHVVTVLTFWAFRHSHYQEDKSSYNTQVTVEDAKAEIRNSQSKERRYNGHMK